MKEFQGPFPSVGWRKRLSVNVMPPMQDVYSGNLVASVVARPMGAARTGAKVTNVWLSALACGRDDSNALMFSGEVFINGTSCLSTLPSINSTNGAASEHKTTKVTGDTGITQAVINTAANTVAAGDVITYTFHVVRTATPTTEIKNAVIEVEFEPII